MAIDAAREAHADWSRLPWEERASVYLRAAELLAGPWRSTLVAATMLNQSKTAHQAEIDAAAELVDFWRFNVEFMLRIYSEQPVSSPGVWNRMEYRPLEGFVFAVSPFNFTAIGGNLSGSPALMGNTVVWKPASSAALSAHYTLQLLREAGLPDGVINLVYGSGATIGDAALASPELAGIHFTGSTPVFQSMWKTVGAEHRELPELPAHRRRDRRQGLHPRPLERRRRRGRDGDRPRLLRVPGAEVLRRLTRLRAEEHVAGAEGAPHRAGRGAPDGRRRRLLELHGRGDRQQLLQDAEGRDRRSPRLRQGRDRGRRRLRRQRGLLREPDRDRDRGPRLPDDARGALRPGRHDLRLRRQALGRHAQARRRGSAVRPHRRRLRRRPLRSRGGAPGAPLLRRQLLRQRQADRRRRRAAAVRRRPSFGHERQGRLDVEPDPLGQPPHDQGDIRAPDRLPLSVHGLDGADRP